MRNDYGALARLRRTLIGDKLHRVGYSLLPNIAWTANRTADGVHDADTGVELSFRSGAVLSAMWWMEWPCEGLTAHLRSTEDESPWGTNVLTDVSQTKQWRPLLGGKVRALEVAWYQPHYACAEMLLAARLQIRQTNVVLALGEATDSGINYISDEVVVIFNEDIASQYGAGWIWS